MNPKSVIVDRRADDQKWKPASGAISATVERILRVPLFFKITVANTAVVGGSALVTAVLLSILVGVSWTAPLVGVGVLGVALVVLASVGVNAVLTSFALRPLERLEETAKGVGEGARDVRVPDSLLADRNLQRLVDVFNRMLDSLEASERERRKLAHTLLEAEERARSQVARDLYDDLAQRLASLLFLLPDPERRRRLSPAEWESKDTPDVRRLRKELTHALETVRKTARRLRPPELDELGLVPALEAEARILSGRANCPIRVIVAERSIELPAHARLAVFRILQEALSNAVRHADASRIEVRVRRCEGYLVADVEDDGHGFDTRRIPAGVGTGPGIRGMGERASYVGGRVEVESAAGVGTTIRVRIPLDGGESL